MHGCVRWKCRRLKDANTGGSKNIVEALLRVFLDWVSVPVVFIGIRRRLVNRFHLIVIRFHLVSWHGVLGCACVGIHVLAHVASIILEYPLLYPNLYFSDGGRLCTTNVFIKETDERGKKSHRAVTIPCMTTHAFAPKKKKNTTRI